MNLATGLAAVAVAFVLPDIFNILVLAYSFWSPLILVPLAAALLGVKSNGRAFRGALLAGLASSLGWNLLLHKPWGIDGAVIRDGLQPFGVYNPHPAVPSIPSPAAAPLSGGAGHPPASSAVGGWPLSRPSPVAAFPRREGPAAHAADCP